MNDKLNFESLATKLETNITATFNEMPINELKKIDWLTWETDFFIEKDKPKKIA